MNALGIDEVEIARVILFQAGDIVMAASRCLDEVAEILVEIGFTVAVEIVQSSNLIAAQHIDLPVTHLETERLKKAGGETFPAKVAELLINARHAPDITVNRADIGRAIGSKVHTCQEHQGFPRIVIGNRQRIDGEKVRVRTALAHGREFGQPSSRAWLEQGLQAIRLRNLQIKGN